MSPLIPRCLAAIALAIVALPAPALSATTQTVNVLLQDASVDPAITGMTIKADMATVKAGRVTFTAVNQSKNMVHEMMVIPTFPEGKELPYDAKHDTVVEKRVHALGEISDLKPGARGKVTLKLKPGSYLLFCNEPGHYKAGMSTKLTVEK